MVSKTWRQRALWGSVLLLSVLGSVLFVRWVTTVRFGASDFNAYWSASRLFLEGRNPVDPENMLEMENANVRSEKSFALMAWNPPTLWVLMLPLAWMPFQVARSVWLLVNVILVLVSCLMLSLVHFPERRVVPLVIYCLVASLFSAVLIAIVAGQVTFLVLFGVAASLFSIKRGRWFWAGAALILTSVKFHLVMLVGPYLMLYMAARRKWAGWLGFGVAGIICLAVLFALRPSWIIDFSALLDAPPTSWATPTIGGFLSSHGMGSWGRYIGIGFLLLLPFFLRRPEAISFETAASLLILVTLPTTFFGWSYDQSLLLVPIAQIVGWLSGPLRSMMGRLGLATAMAAAIVVGLVQRVVATDEVEFFWVPLAWGVIYAAAWWMVSRTDGNPLQMSVGGGAVGARG